MGRKSKRAERIVRADEFDAIRLAAAIRPPITSVGGCYSWDLPTIKTARDAQIAGNFALPARLATDMRTDDAIDVAREVRIAPHRGLPRQIVARGNSARARRIRDEAEGLFGPEGIAIAPGLLADVVGCLADHGIAIAYNVVAPRPDGSRFDFEVRMWPIEAVRYDPTCGVLMARVAPGSAGAREGVTFGSEVPIVHGDGRWTVFSKHAVAPWTQSAAVLKALLWAVHALAWRDWARGAKSHGDTKTVVTPPDGIGTQSEDGVALGNAIADLEAEDRVALVPSGSKVERLSDTGGAWQVYQQLVTESARAWQRIYNGQDGAMGQNPAAPGVSLEALFGVKADIVEGDLRALDRGISEGIIAPWCAMNFGDSSAAPRHEYVFPNPEEDARRAAEGERGAAFFTEMKAARDAGFALAPDWVASRAAAYGLPTPAMLPAVAPVPAPAPAPVPAAPRRIA